MNLTKYDKDAFVYAVVNEIPQVDYLEKRIQLLKGFLRSKLPAEVRKLYDNPETRRFLRDTEVIFMSERNTFPNMGLENHRSADIPKEVADEFAAIVNADREQSAKIREMSSKVWGMIGGIRTLKQAIAQLPPELHKYLPTDRDASKTADLPAITNTVETLKAMGWPKGEPAAAVAA